MKIPTKDTEGRDNGYILTCWNANEHPELRPDQVYVTAIAPHSRKGPHLHMKRRGLFMCIAGEVTIRIRNGFPGKFTEAWITFSVTPEARQGLVIVPPGVPCALYNYGDTEALVLNMPSPPWSAEDPDDHPVTDWKDPDDWPHVATNPLIQEINEIVRNDG